MQEIQPEIESVKALQVCQRCSIPLFSSSVQAGFPSPAEDFIEGTLDLNQLLIQRPSATFMVKVSGLSMIGTGIEPNDILVVDKAHEASHNDIVIAVVDGELTVKRFSRIHGKITLIAENDDFPNLSFTDDSELIIWGVVTSCIKQFKNACSS